jgi:hypothetical protein
MSHLPDKTSEHVQDDRPLEKNDLNSNDEDWEDQELWRIECEILDEIDRRWFEADLAEHRKEREMNKMFVIFFEMRILFSHPKIETIFLEFGHNIPKYVQYEGGSNDGMTVVCCVDSSIDTKSICLENCVHYSKLHEIEIDKMLYNNSHCVYNGYGGYKLESINHV